MKYKVIEDFSIFIHDSPLMRLFPLKIINSYLVFSNEYISRTLANLNNLSEEVCIGIEIACILGPQKKQSFDQWQTNLKT